MLGQWVGGGARFYRKELSFLVGLVGSVSNGRTVDQDLLLIRGIRFECDSQVFPVTKLSHSREDQITLAQRKCLRFLQNCFEMCGFLYWTLAVPLGKSRA